MASPSYKHDKRKNLAQPRTLTLHTFGIFFQIATPRFLAEGPPLEQMPSHVPRALDLVPLTGIKLLFRRLASSMLSGYVAGYLVRRFNPFRP